MDSPPPPSSVCAATACRCPLTALLGVPIVMERGCQQNNSPGTFHRMVKVDLVGGWATWRPQLGYVTEPEYEHLSGPEKEQRCGLGGGFVDPHCVHGTACSHTVYTALFCPLGCGARGSMGKHCACLLGGDTTNFVSSNWYWGLAACTGRSRWWRHTRPAGTSTSTWAAATTRTM